MAEPDITQRLRGQGRNGDLVSPNLYDCRQAADEIEALRRLLAECEDRLSGYEDCGPPCEGWQSDELLTLRAAIREALTQ